MASARLLRNITEDYLNCNICLEIYRDPRQLPCGHSFCCTCLQCHIDARQQPLCPMCNAVVSPPSTSVGDKTHWAACYSTDALINSLLHTLNLFDAVSKVKMTCPEHTGEALKVYCMGHKTVICSDCAWQKHRSSSCDCLTLAEAYKRFSSDIKSTRNQLKSQTSTAISMSCAEDTALQNSKINCHKRLDELKRKLDDFVSMITSQITRLHEEIDITAKNLSFQYMSFASLSASINKTHDLAEEMFRKENSIEILNTFTMLREQVDKFDVALRNAKVQKDTFEIDLRINSDLHKMLSDCNTLGSVEFRKVAFNNESMPASMSKYYRMVEKSSGKRLSSSSSFCDEPETVHSGIFSAKRPGEKNCNLTGIAVTENAIVLVDSKNNNIKRFAKSGEYVDEVKVNGPEQIASVSESNFCVTQPDKKKVTVLKSDSILIIQEEIETKKKYRGITYLGGGRMALSCCEAEHRGVDIMTVGGDILISLDLDDSGKKIFGAPEYVTSTSQGNLVVRDLYRGRVVCMNRDAKLLWTYETSAAVWGVDCGNNIVYVCLMNKDRVVRLNEKDGSMLSKKMSVKKPSDIAVSENVAATIEWGSDRFHVFAI